MFFVAILIFRVQRRSWGRTFEYPIFDGKVDFTMWQCTMKDLFVRDDLKDMFVRDDLDLALQEKKLDDMDGRKWANMQKKKYIYIWLAIFDWRFLLVSNIKQ